MELQEGFGLRIAIRSSAPRRDQRMKSIEPKGPYFSSGPEDELREALLSVSVLCLRRIDGRPASKPLRVSKSIDSFEYPHWRHGAAVHGRLRLCGATV